MMKPVDISQKLTENPFLAMKQNSEATITNGSSHTPTQQTLQSEKETFSNLSQTKQAFKRRTNFRQTLLVNK